LSFYLKETALAITFLQMEPTTRCNFSCWFCCGRHLKQEDLPPDVAKKVMQSIPTLQAMMFQGEGEPLLYRQWYDIVTLARNMGINVSMISNGSLLTKRNIDGILDASVGQVHISIESTDPNMFKSIRGGNLENILSGVRLLIGERNRRKLLLPKVSFKVTVMRQTRDQIRHIFDLHNQLGMDEPPLFQVLQNKVSYIRNYPPEMRDQTLSADEERQFMRDLLPWQTPPSHQPRWTLKKQMQKWGLSRRNGCWWLDHGLYLRADGCFTPCCYIKDHSIGNAANMDLKEIMLQRASFQKQLLHRTIPEPCQGCSVANGIVVGSA
jgi:MoaA/NifB/PqqE/SkfB family radical SAM enzyme